MRSIDKKYQTTPALEDNIWVDGSWKQRADALEQENKWLGNENSQLKAQIKELIRNGRRDL